MTFHRASGPILKQPRIISAAIRKSAQGQACTMRELNDVFSYCQDTGEIRRKANGKRADTTKHSKGYLVLSHKGKQIYAHRLAWALSYGKWPEGVIDHIDHDKTNNRLSNLRDVDHRLNLRNMRRSKANKSGATGVAFHEKYQLWEAKINGNDSRTIFLGRYETFEEAKAARKSAEICLGYSDRHGE